MQIGPGGRWTQESRCGGDHAIAAKVLDVPLAPLRASLLIGVLACLVALLASLAAARFAGGGSPAAVGTAGARAVPAELAPLASMRIGASEASFWALPRGHALRTRGGGIEATFTPSHARLRLASGALAMRLATVGRDSRSVPVAAAAPAARANEVLYRHGPISEYYRNGPFGLEQGFTLRARPVHGARGPLTLDLAVSGTLVPRQRGPQIDFRTRAGETALRYGQLQAIDANGKKLPASIGLQGGTIQLRIDDTGARYPLRVDPFFEQGLKKTGGEEKGAGGFGRAVALSADGNTAVIGGPNDNAEVGAAWVFTRTGSTWSQQGPKLTGAEETGKGRFGSAVALSNDGNTAVIGGYADNGEVGAAWVFTRSAEVWSQQGAKLTGSGESGTGHFGFRVAVSGDGKTTLVGGPADSTSVGAAWVFLFSGTTWEQQAELTGSGESGKGEFGLGVALSGDGNTAFVGGGNDNAGVGAAWAFLRTGTTWAQQGAKLTGSGEVGEGHFGFRVALSEDGNTALVGGGSDNTEVGAAWVFTRSLEVWSQQGAKLTGSGETGKAHFGFSVALSASGDRALIGGPDDNNEVGAAWVFERSAEVWSQLGAKLTGTGEIGKGALTYGAALSGDGKTALLGAPGDSSEVGAAWVFFDGPPPPPTVVTGSASTVTTESASLNATVNPNGEPVSDCHFEYGTSIPYATSVACGALPGSGKTAVAVSADITGLSPNTVYHFRIVATNPGGTSTGEDQTFRSGEPPEFGRCKKVVGVKEGKTVVYHGAYTTAGCTEKSPTKTGKYEWYPGLVKTGFTTKLKEGAVTFETVTKVKVTCKTEKGTGHVSGPREVAGVTLQFTGCESGVQKCTTAGLGEGEIETKQLEGNLGWETKATQKVALDLYPVGKTGAFMEYRCGEIESPVTTVQGSILVPVSHAKMLLTEPLKYKATSGKQKPEHFEGMANDVLTALREEASHQLGLTATLSQTGEEAVEINAVV